MYRYIRIRAKKRIISQNPYFSREHFKELDIAIYETNYL